MAEGEVTPSQAMCLLDSMEDGHFRVTMDDALEEVVRSLRKHVAAAGGKAKGTLIIRIDHVFNGKHVVVKGEVSTKLPKPIRGESFYFATKDNGLTRQDPTQMTLPLRDASANEEPRPMKVVS
jgi:hypothetical protein